MKTNTNIMLRVRERLSSTAVGKECMCLGTEQNKQSGRTFSLCFAAVVNYLHVSSLIGPDESHSQQLHTLGSQSTSADVIEITRRDEMFKERYCL